MALSWGVRAVPLPCFVAVLIMSWVVSTCRPCGAELHFGCLPLCVLTFVLLTHLLHPCHLLAPVTERDR